MANYVPVPYAATMTVPVNEGQHYFVLGPLTGAATVSFSFSPESARANVVTLAIVQDGTGSHAVTWAANVYGGANTSSDAASTTRVQQFFYEEQSNAWYAVGAGAIS